MKLIDLLKVLSLMLIVNISWGQLSTSPQLLAVEECGTKLTQGQVDYMNNTRELRKQVDLSALKTNITYLEVAFHVIIDQEGILIGNDFTTQEVDDALQELNSIFGDQGVPIQFVRCLDVNYISEKMDYPNLNTDYLHPSGESGIYPFFPIVANLDQLSPAEALNTVEFEIALKEKVDNVINIFFSRHIGGYRGLSAFPDHLNDYGKDWIFLQIPGFDAGLIAHEMGHFFNLYHTFQGESEYIDINESENVARPSGGTNICPPGENCNCGPNVGDELCDTAADPYNSVFDFNRCTSPSCEFDGTLVNCDVRTDDIGMEYDPEPSNIMSYSNCRSTFTQQQIDRMLESLANDRSYLNVYTNCSDCPIYRDINDMEHESGIVEEIVTSSHITSTDPVKGETATSSGANIIYNAGKYINLYPGFEAEYTSTFCAIIDGCQPNASFRTISKFLEKADSTLSNFKIRPNPVKSQAVIEYELKNDSKVSFSLFDTTGKQVANLSQNEQKVAGLHQFNFNVSNLPTGIYYCTMQANDHIETQKIVITK